MLVIKIIISELRIFAQLYEKKFDSNYVHMYTECNTTLSEGPFDMSSRSN